MTGYRNIKGKVFEDLHTDVLLTGDLCIGGGTVQLIDCDAKQIIRKITMDVAGEYFFGDVVADAGLFKTAKIVQVVQEDRDRDSFQDLGKKGLAGITV